MSEQGDAFVRRVLKGDPTPASFGDAVAYLRQLGGSGRGAARLAGVDEKSFRRWASGSKPRPATQHRILSAYRDLRSKPSKLGDAGVMIPVVSQDRRRGTRERDIQGKQLQLAPGTLAAAHQIWVQTGDGDAAARRFVAGIGNAWYRVNLGKAMVPDEDEIPGEADHDVGDDYAMSIG